MMKTLARWTSVVAICVLACVAPGRAMAEEQSHGATPADRPKAITVAAQGGSFKFSEVEPRMGKAFFFSDGEVLFRDRVRLPGPVSGPEEDFVMPFRTVLYMRVIPSAALPEPLDLSRLKEVVKAYGVFGFPPGHIAENRHGVICGIPAGTNSTLDDLVQYFPSGETGPSHRGYWTVPGPPRR
jgi:hypothetical protein